MSSYIPIASQTLTSTASSVTFSSIPATLGGKTLRDLVLVISIPGSNNQSLDLRFNGDTNSNYNFVMMRGNGSNTLSQGGRGQSNLNLHFNDSRIGNNANFVVQIFDFAQTDKHKTVLSRYNSSSAMTQATAARWANVAAMTSILVTAFSSGSYNIGSTFSLYGIEG